MKSPSSHWSSDLDQDFIDKVLVRQAGRPGALLGILQQVQNNHPRKFLPRRLSSTSRRRPPLPCPGFSASPRSMRCSISQPQGRDTISVCRGTACHTRGSRDLFEKVMMHFGFPAAPDGEPDQLSVTTSDGSTTLRTVACFGQCALAPVVEVNHAIFGHMNERALQRELEALEQRETTDVTSIRDESGFETGSQSRPGQAAALAAAHRHRHGHLRDRQWSGGRLPCLRRCHRSQRGLDVQLAQTGCFGFCAEEPLVNVWLPGQPLLMLHRVRTDHVGQILDGLTGRKVPEASSCARSSNGTT